MNHKNNINILLFFIILFFGLFVQDMPCYAHLSYATTEIFYTHNDHLGSASWITDVHGYPTQYIHYLPYGQLLTNQMATGYDERFKFIGKERDISHGAPVEVYLNGESGDISCPPIKRSGIGICNLIVEREGYDYFGARYYASPFMHWLSVDPLSDKDPGISPYAYCKWNPINRIDPDGRIVLFAKGVSRSFKRDFSVAVQYMNTYGFGGMLQELNKSKNVYYIAEGAPLKSSEFNIKTKTITWSSRTGYLTNTDYELSPVEVLNHEVDHALRLDKNPEQQKLDISTPDVQFKNLEKKRVITNSEQKVAQKIGRLGKDQMTRTNHKGYPYETNSPISVEGKYSVTPSNSPNLYE